MATAGVVFAVVLFCGAMFFMALQATKRRRLESTPTGTNPDPNNGRRRCPLCDRPLKRRAASSDEIVFEVERRIFNDIWMVNEFLRDPVREKIERLYVT